MVSPVVGSYWTQVLSSASAAVEISRNAVKIVRKPVFTLNFHPQPVDASYEARPPNVILLCPCSEPVPDEDIVGLNT
jgi:hypothetical protein